MDSAKNSHPKPAPALNPLTPERLYVRDFNAEATWAAATLAILEGHDPDTVADLLFGTLHDEDLKALRNAAPIHDDSEEVSAAGPDVLLCRAMHALDGRQNWIANISLASIHAMIDEREATRKALRLALPVLDDYRPAEGHPHPVTDAYMAVKGALELMSQPT